MTTTLSQDSEDPSRSSHRQVSPAAFLRWLVTGNVLATVLLVALVGPILIQDRLAYQQQAARASKNLAQLLEQNIEALIAKTDVSLQTIAHEVGREAARGGLDGRSLEDLLTKQNSLLPELATLRIIDADGKIIYGLGRAHPTQRDLSDRGYFIAARRDARTGLIIDGPIKSRFTGQWVVVLARRLSRPDGSFLGIVSATIAIEHFHGLFSSMDLGAQALVNLRAADMGLIASHPSSFGNSSPPGNHQASPEMKEALRLHPEEGGYMASGAKGGIELIGSYFQIGDYPLYIDVALDAERQLAPWRKEAWRISALTALVILVMVLSSWMAYRLWRRHWLAAESLRESDERFRLMVDAVQDYAVFMLDTQGRVATWNEGARRLTGYPLEEILGQPLSILYPAIGSEQDGAGALAQAEGGKSVAEDGWRLRKNGTLFMANTVITAVRDEQRLLQGFTVILRDVTERRLAEQSAKKANALLLEAVESIAIGFSIYDPEDRLVVCNEAYRSLYRTSRDMIVPGVKFEDLIRYGAGRGQYVQAVGNLDAWVAERVRQHQAANGTPLEQDLDDGRHLLVVEYRAPSGHVVGNCTDITELHRHRHRLEELVKARTAEVEASMAQFRTLIEQAPTAMAMLDKNLAYLAVSRRWIKEFGGGQEDLIGKGLYELHQHLPERWKSTYSAALSGVASRKDQDFWTQPDGRQHWLRWATCPWTDEKGRVGGVIIFAEDITDRISGEERLKESELRFRSAFEQAVVGLAHVGLDGQLLRVNEKLCAIAGYGREELLRSNLKDISRESDRKEMAVMGRRILAGKIPSYSAERQYQRRDGSLVWFSLTISLVKTPGGLPDYFTVTVEDIGRRKAAEFALEEEREIFHNLTRIASDLFWEVDDQYRVTMISEPTGDHAEFDISQSFGRCIWELPSVRVEEVERTGYRRILEAKLPFRNLEIAFRSKVGGDRWFSLSGDPIFSKDGQFKGYRGVRHDISERKARYALLESYQKLLEHQVAEQTAALRAANRELQSFTYAASHDLKAPLGRINSFSALLEKKYRERLDGDGLMFLDFIRRNATRMTALIEDLLAHAQIEQKILDSQPMNLPAAVEGVLKEMEVDRVQGGIQIRCNPPDAVIRANPHGFAQVLRNVLENAFKYSGKAEAPLVEIGGQVKDGRCRLWIRDNGIGFDMAYHDRIFQIFQRLHTYEEFPGSGVGLALVRKAMERMGGSVWAESVPGGGATFFLDLPCWTSAAAAEPADSPIG